MFNGQIGHNRYLIQNQLTVAYPKPFVQYVFSFGHIFFSELSDNHDD